MNLAVLNAKDASVVTPADGADLPKTAVALFIGGAGNLIVTTIKGNNCTFTGIPAGFVLNLQVKRVFATGTTCTNIAAFHME